MPSPCSLAPTTLGGPTTGSCVDSPSASEAAVRRRRLADHDRRRKKRVLHMIFSEIRADHTENGLRIEFKAKPIWEPYVEAVLARQRQVEDNPPTVITSERKTGVYVPNVETSRLVRDLRGWLRLAS